MKHHFLLHRLFLIAMFIVCATAVILLMRQQASASLENNSSDYVKVASSISGRCSDINGTRVASQPSENLCSSGTPSSIYQTNTGWSWKCLGSGGGSSSVCSVIRYIGDAANSAPVEAVKTEVANTSNPETAKVSDSPTLAPISSSTATATSATPIVSSVETKESAASAPQTSGEAVSLISDQVSTEVKAGDAVVTNNIESESIRQSYNVTATLEKPVVKSEAPATRTEIEQVAAGRSTAADQVIAPVELAAPERAVADNFEVEKSLVVAESVVVAAEKLSPDNNPKVAGLVSEGLSVQRVSLSKKEDGRNNVRLAGKAEPNALVTIYIFSNDPVVITVKTDENGDWNYELDKELADGQHEAYVTVTDNAGKIISKSQPIAFVKTAQAATLIPVSELNQSPIEKSSAQYVLTAIVIMSICLALALVFIGFLTHKTKLDEGIN